MCQLRYASEVITAQTFNDRNSHIIKDDTTINASYAQADIT